MYERLWFTALVCVEIISAGEVSSMSHCLSVFAAAAGRLITDDAHPDELSLILTMKTKYKHIVRCYTCRLPVNAGKNEV